MTVPKRRITTAERQLAAARTILDRLTTDYPLWLTAVADTTPAPLRAGRHDTTRGPDRADPTATIALATVDPRIIDVDEAIVGLTATLRWIDDQMRPLLATATPRAREDAAARRAALCADPLCAEYAVALGLCRPHYDAHRYNTRRQAQKPAAAASPEGESYPSGPSDPAAHHGPPGGMHVESTSGVLNSVTVEHRARTAIVECVGTCTRCGERLPGDNAAHVQQLLHAHHTECPART